jgi:uncharacterized lipoprotein YddW (UPF0748 family)
VHGAAILHRYLLLLALLLAACAPDGDLATPETPTPTPDTTVPAAVPCVEGASDDHPIVRLPGDHAAEVAACVARTEFDRRRGGTVVLAGPEAGPGALAVAQAAANDAPLLLTASEVLSAAPAAELERIAPETVIVVGSVEDDVARSVADLLPEASLVRATETLVGDGDRIVVASVHDEASALLAASAVGRTGGTLLLIDGAVPDGARDALRDASTVTIVGGYDGVDAAVEAELRREAGEVRRLSGLSAAETAATVARAHPAENRLVLTSGADGAIATVAAHAAVTRGGALLFSGTDYPGRATDRYLRLGGLAGDVDIDLIGGPDELSSELAEGLELRYEEAAAGGPPTQLRGVWIHLFDDTLKTRQGIDEMLDLVAAANLNTVVVEVVRRHDAYYPSDVLPRTPDPALEPDLDLLDRVVTGAHDRGLEVHAWAPVAPAYHRVYDGLELPSGHVWREHGPRSSDPWVSFDVDGRPGEYLDLAVPGVQDLVAATFAEIAERYPVDAVHHDYVRYDGRRMGYNPIALERFRAETGRSGRPAPDDAEWSAWRRAQATALAERIADAVREANPDVAISMAANTMGASPASAGGYEATRTWSDVFQDWPSWLADGVVDVVMPMHYFREGDDRFAQWYREWVAFTAGVAEGCRERRETGCVAAIGVGAWLNTPEHSLAQLGVATDRTDGWVLFSYQQTADREPHDALLRTLRAGPYAEPAAPPPLR